MASAGGLTRRRGAGGGIGASASTPEDGEDASRVSSPAPKAYNDRAPETSYTGGENGHKIAFDPRDISESEERSKQPKLTLMEEVLLMGLKDKQVQLAFLSRLRLETDGDCVQGLSVILERQHLLRSTRMHSHRTSFQRSREHAKRFFEAALPLGRQSY